MKQYDVRCPICGALNKGLYLEETHGWMECEKCGNEVLSMLPGKDFMVKVPLLKEVAC